MLGQNYQSFKRNQQQSTTHRRKDEETATSSESLTPAMKTIADSLATMNKRMEKMSRVNTALVSFNESFSAFLSGMVINDSAVQWPQAPTDETIQLLREHAQKKAVFMETLEPVKAPLTTAKVNKVVAPNLHSTVNGGVKKRKAAVEVKSAGPKKLLLAKAIKKIIDGLPLDYREQTEKNKNMKKVLEVLMHNPTGLQLKELAEASSLKQYIVTDCVNTLVRNNCVLKDSVKGSYAKFKIGEALMPNKAY